MSALYAKLFWLMHFACHQKPERSFHTSGVQWLLCARCSGAAFGALFVMTVLFKHTARQQATRRNVAAHAALTLPLVVDGFCGFSDALAVGWGNAARFVTGVLFSVGAITLVVFVISLLDRWARSHGRTQAPAPARIHHAE